MCLNCFDDCAIYVCEADYHAVGLLGQGGDPEVGRKEQMSKALERP